MGIVKKVLDFIGGKDPEIFDENGNVVHQLPKQKWNAWNQRYLSGQEYNWKNHTGRKAGSPQARSERPS